MKRISACLGVLVLMFGLVATAQAVPFSVTHDYSGSGIYKGQTYVSLWDVGNTQVYSDEFPFPSVSPAAESISSAFLTITHVGNLSGPLNSELWILTDSSAYSIGTLSSSGSPLFCSPWVTDTFYLSSDVISGITSNSPWSLELRLAETTTLVDNLWVDRATFGGEYTPVPEPASLILLSLGLLGVAARRLKF